jgi:hypothetical protein
MSDEKFGMLLFIYGVTFMISAYIYMADPPDVIKNLSMYVLWFIHIVTALGLLMYFFGGLI